MAQFELPEKYKARYNSLKMSQYDWDELKKEVSESCYCWARTQYQKLINPKADVKCGEGLGCPCSYNFIGYCTVPNNIYCSHQYFAQNLEN